MCGFFVYHILIFLDNLHNTASHGTVSQYSYINHKLLRSCPDADMYVLFFRQNLNVMYPFLFLQTLQHSGNVARRLKHLHTETQ